MTIYGLTGVIIQPFRQNVIFEGTSLGHDISSNKFSGRLDDIYGRSSIKGSLNLEDGSLDFLKEYDGRKYGIEYKFKKMGDIWLGTWEGVMVGFGEALCELYENGTKPKLPWQEIRERAQLSEDGEEIWAKRMVEEMVEEGIFLEVKDVSSGERYLLPTKKSRN